MVTGASGQVGRGLRRALAGRASGVFLARDALDVTDAAAIERALDRARPDVVFHAAGYTDVDGAEGAPGAARAINVDSCARLGALCRARGILLVSISSDYVFDGALRRPYREEDAPGPLGVYGRTKREGEEAVRSSGCEHLIVRGQGIYGDGRRHLVAKLLASEDPAARFEMADDRTSQPTLAEDFAEALVALWEAGARGTFHAANRGPLSWYRFACLVRDLSGRPAGEIVPVPASARPERAPRPAYSALDVTKYEAATGRRMRSVEEALRDYLRRVTAP